MQTRGMEILSLACAASACALASLRCTFNRALTAPQECRRTGQFSPVLPPMRPIQSDTSSILHRSRQRPLINGA